MGTSIGYQGKSLGSVRIDENQRWVFVADDLTTLEKLFSLKPEDILEIEGTAHVTYQRFGQETLPRIHAFYPTMHAYLVKNINAEEARKIERQLGILDH